MGLGLEEGTADARMLGIFISHGGRLVKEKYNLLKGTPKRKISNVEVSAYRHARDVVDKSISMERKLTCTRHFNSED